MAIKPVTYEKAVDYHRALRKGHPPQVATKGKSKCASDITLDVAQQLLDGGARHGKLPGGYPRSIFAQYKDTWYQARSHKAGCYHGFPVREQKVPPAIRLKKQRKPTTKS